MMIKVRPFGLYLIVWPLSFLFYTALVPEYDIVKLFITSVMVWVGCHLYVEE